MENFRFILENPHPNANHNKQRKRARLVTACDSCRVKKIKCQQTSPNGRCEACKIAKTPCLFGDRDRYQAERGVSSAWTPLAQDIGPLSMPSSSNLIDLSFRHPRPAYLPYTTTRSPKQRSDSTSRSATPSSYSLTHPLPSDSPRPPNTFPQTDHQHHHMSNSLSNTNIHAPPNDVFDDPLSLDHQRPRSPYPQRMQYLTTLFFDTIGHSFPFLDRVDILHRIEQKTCSPILANIIASLALRYTGNAEDLSASSRFYGLAKNLAAGVVTIPSIEALHALICITWSEYGMGQMETFWIFSRMVITMCLDLGLGHETTIQVAVTPEIRSRLRLTWWTVVCVADISASWATGRSTTIDLSKYDTELPSGSDERVILFCIMTRLYLLRSKVGRAVELYVGNRSNSSLDWSISELQSELQQIIDSLPLQLTFNIENMAHAKERGLAVNFLQIHFLIHSMTVLVNQPSLLAPHDLPIALQSTQIEKARSSVKYLVEIIMILQDVLGIPLQEPFIDLSLLTAIRFLMTDAQNTLIKSNNGNKPWQMVLIDICKDTLVSLSSQCGNDGSFETLLKEKGGNFQLKPVLLPSTQATEFTVSGSSMDWLLRPAPSDDNSSDTSGSFRSSSSRELSPLNPPDSTPSREPPSIRTVSPLVHAVDAYSTSTLQPDLNYAFLAMTETPAFYQYNNCAELGLPLSENSQSEFALHPQRNMEKSFVYHQVPLPWPLTS